MDAFSTSELAKLAHRVWLSSYTGDFGVVCVRLLRRDTFKRTGPIQLPIEDSRARLRKRKLQLLPSALMKRQKLELSLTQPENFDAGIWIAHKSLRICERSSPRERVVQLKP